MPGFLAGVFVDREERHRRGVAGQHHHRAGPARVRPAGRPARRRAAHRRRLDAVAVAGAAGPARRLVLGARRRTCCARSAGGLLHLGPLPGRAGRASRFAAPATDGTWVGLDGYYAGETLRIADDHLDLGTFIFTRTPYDPAAPVPGGVDERGWQLT